MFENYSEDFIDGLHQQNRRNKLLTVFQHFSRDEMRVMWDNIGDNSFFGPYDCADIHAWMNFTGDGDYCAV